MTDSDDEETAPLVLAAIGTVLLVLAGAGTFVVGLLTPLVEGCETEYAPGDPPFCRNAGAVNRIMTLPVLIVMPVGLLLTWLRFAPPYRPRAWVPAAGLAVLAALWLVGNLLLDGRLL